MFLDVKVAISERAVEGGQGGGVGGQRKAPHLSLTKDFFKDITAENGEILTWKFRFEV